MARSAVFPALRFRPEFGITPGLSAIQKLRTNFRVARYPELGPGTLYDNLQKLTEQGMIETVLAG
jgi:hypothetical protein